MILLSLPLSLSLLLLFLFSCQASRERKGHFTGRNNWLKTRSVYLSRIQQSWLKRGREVRGTEYTGLWVNPFSPLTQSLSHSLTIHTPCVWREWVWLTEWKCGERERALQPSLEVLCGSQESAQEANVWERTFTYTYLVWRVENT